MKFAASFLEAAPYLVRARGAHFVLWADRDLPAAELPGLAEELATLHALGVQLTLIVDGGPEDGQPLDAQAQAAAAAVAHGEIRRWTDLLSRGWIGIPDRRYRLSVLTGNLVTARRIGVVGGTDHGQLGRVRAVDRERIAELLGREHMLLFGGALPGATGLPLWVPPLDLAVAVAVEMEAAKLVLLTPNMPDTPTPAEWTVEELAGRTAAGRPARLLDAAAQASRRGVARVHFVDGSRRGALIRELFSRSGSGVLVTRDPSSIVQPIDPAELSELVALISRWEPEGALAPRSRELIEANLESFRVLKADGRIAACGALRFDAEDADEALIESVAVHAGMQREGYGQAMLRALERESRERGATRAWVLTTVAEEWFEGFGYVREPLESAPAWVARTARPGRNSLLLRKSLAVPERSPL
jgi:amino-acid N-acetyltransferase